MRNIPTSNTAILPFSSDEDIAVEADEPPESRPSNDYFPPSYRVRDAEGFCKSDIHQFSPPKESLLTRALLTSPTLGPIDRPIDRPSPPSLQRGMSNSSVWSNNSNGSTADLTSDAGMTSPSRASTPSPPPPMYLSQIAEILQGSKPSIAFAEPKRIQIVSDRDSDVVEGLGRKRCITFACGGQNSRRSSVEEVPKTEDFQKIPADTPKKSSALTFACTQRGEQQVLRPKRSPPPAPRHIDFALRAQHCPAPPTTGIDTTAEVRPFIFSSAVKYHEPRKLYDTESAEESWTNQPFDKSRLLRVDDVLRKEMDIRKLSEEAEAERLQEEGEDDDSDEEEEEDTLLDDSDAEDEEEDDQDEDDYDYDYDNESGNETDNEEGFASGDESDDEYGFYGLHPPMIPVRPICDRAGDSYQSYRMLTSPRLIRPQSPELPDSTDFVCGTFDEDKALEEAYLSCLEERKRSKHKPIPQDIDPSFPTSDPEDDSDHEDLELRRVPSRAASKATARDDSSSDGNHSRGRKARGTDNMSPPPPPRGRVHSPAPVRRTALAHSPAPVRRTTLAQSPAPSRRMRSPSPPRRGSRALSPIPLRRRATFQTHRDIVRSRSLPRKPGMMAHRAVAGRTSSRINSAAASPQKATRPMVIRRGAVDIFKGLEKKRERRKARKYREERWEAGEGVEKMRELGLVICGAGKSRPIWVMSA